jgi:hypothetical protein
MQRREEEMATSGDCQKCGSPSCTLKATDSGDLWCASCRGQQIHRPQPTTLKGVYLTPRIKETP